MDKFEVDPWSERCCLHPESGVIIPILASANIRHTSSTSARNPKGVDFYKKALIDIICLSKSRILDKYRQQNILPIDRLMSTTYLSMYCLHRPG